jgi:hypothetical protein
MSELHTGSHNTQKFLFFVFLMCTSFFGCAYADNNSTQKVIEKGKTGEKKARAAQP